MAASSTIISCCSYSQARPPPAPAAKEPAAAARLRRACVAAAAACVVIGATGGGGGVDGAAMAEAYDAVHVQAAAPARWSERRQCPPWRANSLENIVPENLPRPSVRRRFNSVEDTAAAERAPAPPDAVVPFLALHSGLGCFSL